MPKVLFVLSSHPTLGDTDKPTGWYVPEAAHPHAVLTREGLDVEFASPQGGAPPMIGVDESDAVQRSFLADPGVAEAITNTKRLDEIEPDDYDAVLLVGGHGTMWDFRGNAALAGLIASVYERGGAVSAVCHGPAGLVDVRTSDGEYLVAGRRVAAFTDAEEDAVGLAGVVPFLLERTLAEQGASIVKAEPFLPQVQVDDRLVTGQNPASATPLAEALVAVLRSSTPAG